MVIQSRPLACASCSSLAGSELLAHRALRSSLDWLVYLGCLGAEAKLWRQALWTLLAPV